MIDIENRHWLLQDKQKVSATVLIIVNDKTQYFVLPP